VNDIREPCAGEPRCTTRLENAHRTEFRELLSPFHPWCGLRVAIHAAIERLDGVVFRCDLAASVAERWLITSGKDRHQAEIEVSFEPPGMAGEGCIGPEIIGRDLARCADAVYYVQPSPIPRYAEITFGLSLGPTK
jgi:hypothetical protein